MEFIFNLAVLVMAAITVILLAHMGRKRIEKIEKQLIYKDIIVNCCVYPFFSSKQISVKEVLQLIMEYHKLNIKHISEEKRKEFIIERNNEE